MPAPTITTLPLAPSRNNDPATFIVRADALVAALAEFVADANAQAAYLDGLAAAVDADQVAIAEATAAALVQINTLLTTVGFSGTSNTNHTIGTGTKTLTTQTGRSFVPGTQVTVAVTATPSVNFMTGIVTAYNSATGSLTVDVLTVNGSGTFNTWSISLSGARGPTGAGATFAFANSASATQALAIGTRTRLTVRVTGGTLPVSPGIGGEPIEIMTAIDASANFHTFTPNGAETVTVNGVAGSPFLFDGRSGQTVRLIPITGGWQMGD